jgi:hypothetical protein
MKQAISLSQRFSKQAQTIFEESLEMLVASDIGSKDFNYAWDILRAHVDHFRYNQICEESKPQVINQLQPPLEANAKFGSCHKVIFNGDEGLCQEQKKSKAYVEVFYE